jgi:hypothetical protein
VPAGTHCTIYVDTILPGLQASQHVVEENRDVRGLLVVSCRRAIYVVLQVGDTG